MESMNAGNVEEFDIRVSLGALVHTISTYDREGKLLGFEIGACLLEPARAEEAQ